MIVYTNACGLYIYMYTFYRAWKRQLYKVVRNQKHQAEIYACLWMLMSQLHQASFVQNQATFLSYWQDKEPQFVSYYKQEYLERAGNIYSDM